MDRNANRIARRADPEYADLRGRDRRGRSPRAGSIRDRRAINRRARRIEHAWQIKQSEAVGHDVAQCAADALWWYRWYRDGDHWASPDQEDALEHLRCVIAYWTREVVMRDALTRAVMR